MNFIKKITRKEDQSLNSKDAAKERLHLVLMQDRANVSADFLELMKQEIIEVIKKYIDVDETAIDVRLTNKDNGDGTKGAPALYANIPIVNIKDEVRQKATTNTQTTLDTNSSKDTQKTKVEDATNKEEVQEKQDEQENNINESNKNSEDGENIIASEESKSDDQKEQDEKVVEQKAEDNK